MLLLLLHGQRVTRVEGDYGIPSGEEGESVESSVETVIDVADAGRLQELTLDAKAFMAEIKTTCAGIKEALTEAGREEEAAKFQEEATAVIRGLIPKVRADELSL